MHIKIIRMHNIWLCFTLLVHTWVVLMIIDCNQCIGRHENPVWIISTLHIIIINVIMSQSYGEFIWNIHRLAMTAWNQAGSLCVIKKPAWKCQSLDNKHLKVFWSVWYREVSNRFFEPCELCTEVSLGCCQVPSDWCLGSLDSKWWPQTLWFLWVLPEIFVVGPSADPLGEASTVGSYVATSGEL